MRVVVVFCLLFPVIGAAQIPFDSAAGGRLEIEVVPVIVVEQDTLNAIETDPIAQARLERDLIPQFTKMFNSTRDALFALGVEPDEYDLRLGDLLQVLVCNEATVFFEQTCGHSKLGIIADLPNFILNLYDSKPSPRGTVQLNILLLESEVAWKGTLGVAWRWWWTTDTSLQHWSNTTCRAWALHSISVIAHELGHCFKLAHNEDDSDNGLDLMVSHYAHFNWVKGSNKAIVREHFRLPIPLGTALRDTPLVELHY